MALDADGEPALAPHRRLWTRWKSCRPRGRLAGLGSFGDLADRRSGATPRRNTRSSEKNTDRSATSVPRFSIATDALKTLGGFFPFPAHPPSNAGQRAEPLDLHWDPLLCLLLLRYKTWILSHLASRCPALPRSPPWSASTVLLEVTLGRRFGKRGQSQPAIGKRLVAGRSRPGRCQRGSNSHHATQD